jgi:multisubunit Na+/H+ antiporter MnhE subunit
LLLYALAMRTLVFLLSEFPIWALVSAAVLTTVVLGAPVAAIVLWVTRRYGSPVHGDVRQLRIVRVRQTRVYGARRRASAQRQREAS